MPFFPDDQAVVHAFTGRVKFPVHGNTARPQPEFEPACGGIIGELLELGLVRNG
jgi:hypothetical protein